MSEDLCSTCGIFIPLSAVTTESDLNLRVRWCEQVGDGRWWQCRRCKRMWRKAREG